ncbi:MAG: hypothetical protein WD894_07790 [Pirellulales bacterium]
MYLAIGLIGIVLLESLRCRSADPASQNIDGTSQKPRLAETQAVKPVEDSPPEVEPYVEPYYDCVVGTPLVRVGYARGERVDVPSEDDVFFVTEIANTYRASLPQIRPPGAL